MQAEGDKQGLSAHLPMGKAALMISHPGGGGSCPAGYSGILRESAAMIQPAGPKPGRSTEVLPHPDSAHTLLPLRCRNSRDKLKLVPRPPRLRHYSPIAPPGRNGPEIPVTSGRIVDKEGEGKDGYAVRARGMEILIADDDPVSRRLLEASLKKWDYQVVSACDGAQAWELLQEASVPRLAILDWMMPGLSGPEVCRNVRMQAREPYTYILLLTARNQKEDLIEGMEAGADDYITKPFDAQELKVRLRAGRRILELQAELVAAREALREQATHDSLTRLWNRSSILDILKREMAKAERETASVGLIMVDLDHFKQINDTHGHMTGDEVLREAARRMQASLRSYDAVGRYGGEEFLIVSPGSSQASAIHLAERLRSAIHREPLRVGEKSLTFSISLGVAAVQGVATTPEVLIRAADEALYRAKELGRNRVESAGS
jgi:two-component system cell cycle response regulator